MQTTDNAVPSLVPSQQAADNPPAVLGVAEVAAPWKDAPAVGPRQSSVAEGGVAILAEVPSAHTETISGIVASQPVTSLPPASSVPNFNISAAMSKDQLDAQGEATDVVTSLPGTFSQLGVSSIPSSRVSTRQSSQASMTSVTSNLLPPQQPLQADDGIAYSLQPHDYDVGKVIGFGSSAEVHIARYKPADKVVAIKMLDLDVFERDQIEELRKELLVMSLCKHPNLLSIKGSFVVDSKLYIVTPYLSAGSCLDIMKYGFSEGFEEAAIAVILKQALQGLDYLHRNSLIHRDVKAGNLLMDEDGTVKLADFGVSSSLFDAGERDGLRKTFVGTPCWIAPEVVQQIGHDGKADIWSFGITALELAHGRAPFAKFPPMKVLLMTLQNEPPTLDRSSKKKFSRAFKEMIDSCLQKDPTKRPSAEKLLTHPFFKSTKKKQHLVDTIVKKIPPVSDRSHKEPKKEQREQPAGQSWDFSDDQPPTLGAEELGSPTNSAIASPVTSMDMLSSAVPASASSDPDLLHSTVTDATVASPTAASSVVQKKKGRFVVDLPAPPTNNAEQHNAGAQQSSSNAPQPPPTQPAMVAHSRNPSAGTPQPLPATTVAPEIKKGRFSVIGETLAGIKEAAVNAAGIGGAGASSAAEAERENKVRFEVRTGENAPKTILAEHVPSAGSQTGVTLEGSQRRGRFEVTSNPHAALSAQTSTESSKASGGGTPFVDTKTIPSASTSTAGIRPSPSSFLDVRMQDQLAAILVQAEQQRNLVAELLAQVRSPQAGHLSSSSASPLPLSPTAPQSGVISADILLANMLTTQTQVKALLRENEQLKEENTRLRARIAGLDEKQPPPSHTQ